MHALGRLHAAICDGLNRKQFTTFVSLDLQAAFDTVWHAALVFKMVKLQFPSFLVKSIQSFLAARTFAVRVGDFITESGLMSAGTPQGSVVSPILFDLFLYDIPTDDFVNTLQFADDTSAYCTSNDAARVQHAMNVHLLALSNYFRVLKLKLNESKSVLVVFMGFVRETNARLRGKFRSMTISINGHQLKHDTRVKFLGVVFNRNNRFVQHVDYILKKARGAFFSLRPIIRSRLIDPKVRVNIYRCYVRPIMTYAAAIWARPICLSSHQMERLRAFERRVLRTASGFHRAIGSYMYARDSELYRHTDCPRIDRFMVDSSIRFFESCSESLVPKLNTLSMPGICGIFPDLPNIWQSNCGGQLLTNGILRLFNRTYDGTGMDVYGAGQ